MPTTFGQLVAQLRERNTPTANQIEAEIEETMLALTELESDGSFEFTSKFGSLFNPAVLGILNERYQRNDGGGWTVEYHEPNLIRLVPQSPPKLGTIPGR
jgi:hypothetical protein